MAAIDNIIANLKLWPAQKKIAALAIIIVSVAGMLLLSSWIQKIDYQVLYSNLSDDDAGKIAQELQSKKIPYKAGSGGTILVASDQVYDVRLQLAAQGLPQGGGVGFEIFDNTNFTTSEFVQKLNFRRALEGELSRTIRSLSGVQQCRVHLVVPDKSIFAFQQDKKEASAAVLLSLKQGRKLNSGEVDGIIHLVASSVEGLSAENITVVDNKGELLQKPNDDSMLSLSGSQMEFQHNYEKNMATKIISMLESVAGRGKVKAKVSADFDFKKSERTEEKFDPEGVVVRSEQKSTEKSSSGAPAGVPGVASNIPGGAGQQYAASSQGQSQKQDEMINYETSKTVTHTVESPVNLERLTVAILVDGILPSQQGSVENAKQYVQRSEEDLKFYEDIIKKTVGFTSDRGDEISVKVMPFRELEAESIEEAPKEYMPIVLSVLKYLAPLAAALLFFLFILRPLLKSLNTPALRMQSAATGVIDGAGMQGIIQQKELPLEKQVIEWANKNPQQAELLVKGWLEEK